MPELHRITRNLGLVVKLSRVSSENSELASKSTLPLAIETSSRRNTARVAYLVRAIPLRVVGLSSNDPDELVLF